LTNQSAIERMNTMHSEAHPLAGKTVHLKDLREDPSGETLASDVYQIEDWWDRLTGGSWMDAVDNPAALGYAVRAGSVRLPLDNEVVYGKVGAFGHLMHVSELGSEVNS